MFSKAHCEPQRKIVYLKSKGNVLCSLRLLRFLSLVNQQDGNAITNRINEPTPRTAQRTLVGSQGERLAAFRNGADQDIEDLLDQHGNIVIAIIARIAKIAIISKQAGWTEGITKTDPPNSEGSVSKLWQFWRFWQFWQSSRLQFKIFLLLIFMSATILDGNKIATQIRAELADEVKRLSVLGKRPGLAVILAGH